MECEPRANLLQGAEILPDKTEEINSQEEHRSTENVNTTGTVEEINIPFDVPTRQHVKWSQINDNNS